MLSISGHTADNKRFSEMAVGVEVGSLLLPMTPCGCSGHGVPNPPHRQAAGRYTTYTLVLCYPIEIPIKKQDFCIRRIFDP